LQAVGKKGGRITEGSITDGQTFKDGHQRDNQFHALILDDL
jgi:hypothetical protein